MVDREQPLNGIYDLMAKAYEGYWQYRAADTPYMSKAFEEGRKESIPSHVWSCCMFWLQLRRICPKLDSLVNSTEIYEILLTHDLGETLSGDTPLYKFVHSVFLVNRKKGKV